METDSCGPGLAENAALPRKLGELIAAMADVLDLHRRSLDVSDQAAQTEHRTYTEIVADQRDVAKQLAALADRMTAAHDLPPAPHDEAALSSPDNVAAFVRFVTLKQELQAWLEASAEDERQMLAAARGEG